MTLHKALLIKLFPLAVSTLLAGCFDSVPECHDAQIEAAIQKEYINMLTGVAELKLSGAYKQNFIQEAGQIKITLSEQIQNSYNQDSKKRVCRANLSNNLLMIVLDGEMSKMEKALLKDFKHEVGYSVQGYSGSGSKFKVELSEKNSSEILEFMILGVRQKILNDLYSGAFKGNYSCSGLNNESEGSKGPYTMPVVLDSKNKGGAVSLALNRTTLSGGIEKLMGSGNEGGEFNLSGEGANSADDTWKTEFFGMIEKNNLTAKGVIKSPDGEILRKCELNLSKIQ
jgi:hypothetical protein